jgi:predicted O-methyltransferase YrrM
MLEEILSKYRMLEENDGWDGGYRVNRLYGLEELIKENLKPEFVICEIGSFVGYSTMLFAYYCKEIYSIDLFSPTFNGIDYEPLYDQNIKPFKNIHKIKGDSQIVHSQFEDNYFDFVYVDGSHLYLDVKKDIEKWLPKVKKGGLLGGHDYMYEVKTAVDEIFGKPDAVYGDSSWIIKV